MEKVPITRQGYHRLVRELTHLRRVIRPCVIEELREARAFGVKTDNQQYLIARERHVVLQRKICELERMISECEVFVGRKFLRKRVGFGVMILLLNIDSGLESRYEMVGPYESDVSRGRLSVSSPVGRCLMGCGEGEEVTVHTPSGIRIYRILAIDP
ncbi:MAG: GreA/GreB family elongation factor [Syntrophobacteraceae bacterium]|jgi:transcription elongation factor GreA|nr:GreA/GreB family elongation factor [Syntrophobacteraceae bacterium]